MEVMDAANNVQAFHGLLNDCGTVTSPRGDANRCELFRDRYPNGVERQLANDGGVNSLVNAHLSVSQNNYTGSAVIGGGGVNTQSLSRPADVNPSNSNNLAVVNSGHIEICHSGFMYNCAN